MASSYDVVTRDRADTLGEGPMWSARDRAVYWVDIIGKTVSRLHLGDRRVSAFVLPEMVGWVLERANAPGLIAGLATGFHDLTLDPFDLRLIGDPEPELVRNRLNDATVDRFGRIWAGTMNMDGDAATGALYRLDTDRQWSRQDDGYIIANGPVFDPSGAVAYHTDTALGRVYRFAVDAGGSLHDKRLFVEFPTEWGRPDGMTTDAEGGVWIAHWDGGRISRFSSTGELDHAIVLPASRITNCVFAGDGLDRMFVTSASEGRTDEPLAGALFEVDPGVKGLAPFGYRG